MPTRAGSNQGREACANGRALTRLRMAVSLNCRPKMLAKAIRVTTVMVNCIPGLESGKKRLTMTIITIVMVIG